MGYLLGLILKLEICALTQIHEKCTIFGPRYPRCTGKCLYYSNIDLNMNQLIFLHLVAHWGFYLAHLRIQSYRVYEYYLLSISPKCLRQRGPVIERVSSGIERRSGWGVNMRCKFSPEHDIVRVRRSTSCCILGSPMTSFERGCCMRLVVLLPR